MDKTHHHHHPDHSQRENGRSESSASQITQWVLQAQQGDRSAFQRLADHFQPEIYRMIFFRTRSRMDAEDLTQDVLLRSFKNLGRLNEPKVFRSWLYRIAVNRVRDYYRRRKFKALFGFVSVDDQDSVRDAPEMVVPPEAPVKLDRREFWRLLHDSLSGLPRMEREVFALRFLDQLSIREISETLEKNENTVKTHLYRALKKIRQKLPRMEELLEGVS